MTTPSDRRAEQLFQEGARLLAARWDDAAGMVRQEDAPEFHGPRGTLAYAHVLLREDNLSRAERAIRSVLALQEMREQDAHYGNFRWLLEEECVRDLNGVEFMLDEIIALAREHATLLSPDLAAEMRHAIELGLGEIERLDVHPSYTNIVLSDITNSVLGGELLGDARYIERGARRLDEWLMFTSRSGAPHEFNSPTYAAVDILRLAALARHTRDATIALKARVAEEWLWLHVAAHYHPGLAQLAGPHARSYFDGWSGASGYLKLLLWRLLGDDALRRETPYAPRSREEGEIGVALAELHCPDYIERWLREKRYPFESREIADVEYSADNTTYLTESYALGTASRPFRAGEPRELWPGTNSLLLHVRRDEVPGYSTLYVRYLVNDKAPSLASGGGHGAEDLWEEGQHVAVQHRNRAIVAYCPLPRARAARSYKLSLRMLGVSPRDEVWVGERRVDAWPCVIAPEERVVIAIGDAYVALIPLAQTDMGSDAPVELNLVDGTLTLDIYNYRGPAKVFWEYRSQSGAFFKGNVRNAFALEVAERAEFADVAAFRRHTASAQVTDAIDAGHKREITYASDGGSVALTYSLWDMSMLERICDGIPYAPPMARAGATDGSGMQSVLSSDASIELGVATLECGAGANWLIADGGARCYVAIHPSDVTTHLRLRTADTEIVCSAFGFGRIDLDEARGLLRVETTVSASAVRVIRGGDLQMTVNGELVEATRA